MARKNKAETIDVGVDEDTVSPDTVSAEKPNLKLIGKFPVMKFDTESGVITLPADQSEPFFHEQAVLIAQRLPNYYQTYDCTNCGK